MKNIIGCLDMNPAPEKALYDSLLKKIDFDIDKDYLEFIRNHNGADGFIAKDDYIAFWNIDDVIALNPYYEDIEEGEHLFFFATNGSNFGYAFDKRDGNVVGIEHEDIFDSEPRVFASSFKVFLDTITRRQLKMKNIYYVIWVDSILRFKKHNPRDKNWKMTVLMFNTWMNALNWWVIFMIIKYFDLLNIQLTTLNIFPGNGLDDFFSFVLQFALPFGILNYFLIFYKNRYERLIKEYGPQKRNYAIIYVYVSTLGALAIAITYGILTGTIYS